MSKPFLKIDFDEKSVDKVAVQIEEYANSLTVKMNRVVNRLLDLGCEVAREIADQRDDAHKFARLVVFAKGRIEESDGRIESEMVGHGQAFESHWVDSDGKAHDDIVYPLLMIEFGSAGYAISSPSDTFGAQVPVGKGSMAKRGNENKYSWYIRDDYGYDLRLGTAVQPSRPMYEASTEMYLQALRIIKEEFEE